jgi:predicted PurR-regulated permease PerM
LLTPVIAGRATNLGPVSVFVAVLAGASLAGVYGMLLAIPAAACIKILASEMLMPALREWAAGRASDPLPIDRD